MRGSIQRTMSERGTWLCPTALHRMRQWSIGRCSNHTSLAADRVKGVILTAFLLCNPPPKGQKLHRSVIVLDRLDAGRLRLVSRTGGFIGWDDLSW